jgi:hypothetical protein
LTSLEELRLRQEYRKRENAFALGPQVTHPIPVREHHRSRAYVVELLWHPSQRRATPQLMRDQPEWARVEWDVVMSLPSSDALLGILSRWLFDPVQIGELQIGDSRQDKL